jgi:hypothetical protein
MKILVTARSFRKTPGRHKELLGQSGHQVVESPLDRPLKEEEIVELIADVDGAILAWMRSRQRSSPLASI